MRRILFSIVLIFIGLISLSAQDHVDLVQLHYLKPSTVNFKQSSGLSSLQEFALDLSVPIPLKNEKYVFLTGFSHDRFQVRTFPQNQSPSKFLGSVLKLGLVINQGEKRKISLLALPKFANVGGFQSGFQLGLVSLVRYSYSEQLDLKYGAYFNSEFFGPFLVPIIGLEYKSKNQRFKMNFNLPINADLSYQLLEQLHFGLRFNGLLRSYSIPGLDAYMARADNQIGIYADLEPKKSFIFRLMAGTCLGRSNRIYSLNDQVPFSLSLIKFGDDRQQLNPDLEQGMFFKLKFVYRLYLPKD